MANYAPYKYDLPALFGAGWEPFCSITPTLPLIHGPDCAVWRGWHRERRFRDLSPSGWARRRTFVPARLGIHHEHHDAEFMG